MAEDHADEYPIIRAAIEDLVTAPLYVGQDPKHADRFYVVRRIEPVGEKTHGLVAIGFERNQFGTYNVKSAYGIRQQTVDSRRQAGRLKQVF